MHCYISILLCISTMTKTLRYVFKSMKNGDFRHETSTSRLNSGNRKTLIALQNDLNWLLLYSFFPIFPEGKAPAPPTRKLGTPASHQLIQPLLTPPSSSHSPPHITLPSVRKRNNDKSFIDFWLADTPPDPQLYFMAGFKYLFWQLLNQEKPWSIYCTFNILSLTIKDFLTVLLEIVFFFFFFFFFFNY